MNATPVEYGTEVSLCLDAARAPLLARPYFAEGDPGPIVAALAQVPELMEVALPFISAALGPSAVDWRSKEIVIVRTSALAGCRFCVQAHTVVALDAGLSHHEVRALTTTPGPVGGEVFGTPSERALLDWIEVVAGGGPVDDAARVGLRRWWADHEVVELTVVIGVTLLLNRFATALALPTGAATLERLASEGLL